MKHEATYFLSLLLACVIILAACAPAATQAPAQPAAELTMWTWKLNHLPGLQAVAQNFEKETGIKVTVSAFNPDDAYRTKLTTSAQSGDLPDIMSYWTGGSDFWNYAGSGVIVDLTSKIDDQWKNSFLPGTFDKSSVFTQARYDACQQDPTCTYQNIKAGQVFSVPYMAGSAYFVYGSKPLMKQAGLDPNVPPKTAEEWRDMMMTIKEKTGVAGVVTGVQNPDVSVRWLFNPLLMTSCSQETFDAIYNGYDSFQNECATRVFDFVYSLTENKLWTADILQTDIDPADAAMAQGKAAFDIGGTYTLSGLLAHGMKAEDIIAFAVPPLKEAKLDHLSVGVDGLIEAAITRDSKHPDKALQFLKFLTSPDQAAIFASTVGDLPAVKLEPDPELVGNAMAGLIVSLDPANAPFGKTTSEPLLDEILNVLRPGFQAFITGEITPDQLAENSQNAAVAAWESHGGPKPVQP